MRIYFRFGHIAHINEVPAFAERSKSGDGRTRHPLERSGDLQCDCDEHSVDDSEDHHADSGY